MKKCDLGLKCSLKKTQEREGKNIKKQLLSKLKEYGSNSPTMKEEAA